MSYRLGDRHSIAGGNTENFLLAVMPTMPRITSRPLRFLSSGYQGLYQKVFNWRP